MSKTPSIRHGLKDPEIAASPQSAIFGHGPGDAPGAAPAATQSGLRRHFETNKPHPGILDTPACSHHGVCGQEIGLCNAHRQTHGS